MSNQFALEVTDLSKTYSDGTEALKKANLKISRGDFFGLLGANGAGKTTLIGIVTGLVKKTGGKVRVHNLDLDKDHSLLKEKIGVVPQEFNFSIFERVEDIVTTQAGFFGIKRAEALKRTEKLLHDLELYDKRKHQARMLSGGMKRRLMIARALIHNPEFLILDEPTAGVDVELRHGMWEYLKMLNLNGTTILLTTHYLEEAEQLCNNIAIIKQGEIIKSDSKTNLLKSLEEESYLITIENAPANFKHKKFIQIDENTLETTIYKNYSLNQAIQELTSQKIQIIDLKPKGNRLEKLFLNIIK
jgi:ABC-2 type transport system ATP-binding protein